MKKLSKSESGKLGAIASLATVNRLKQERVDEYNKNPKLCQNCNSPISYDKKKCNFCNRSCAAIYNNKKHQKRHAETHSCLMCENIISIRQKICSEECRRKEQMIGFNAGLISERKTLKNILKTIVPYECDECDIKEWNGKPLSLQLDHEDGNAGNNLPGNLRFICPNCHSQTPTFAARNKGNGRKSRGLPLH